LDNNKITNVDIVTDYFPNLEFLELSKNPITNYSTLDKLKHLKHLQLSHCGLREVPQNIYSLKEL
jgi:Leucine-rich repeat (LRR) protein